MTDINLKDILTIYNKDIKSPEIVNGSFALDMFSPETFCLYPECNIKLAAGFGLKLPSYIGGLITPKNSSFTHFSISPGQIIHPSYDGELTLNLKYHGRDEEVIRKDDPLCQIVFHVMVKINE